MVQIQVRVARCMDKVARLQPTHLSHHHTEQRIRRYVERHAQERIGRPLIQLQRQAAFSHIELEYGVTRWQRHPVHLGHVPCRHNHTSGVRVMLDLIKHILYLVDGAPVIVGPRTPLVPIHRTQLAILVGPFVPYSHPVFLQVVHIRVALQKPQQFIDDRLQVQLLRRQQREALFQVKPHLVSEYALRARPCAVTLLHPFAEYPLQQIQILFHFTRYLIHYDYYFL